MINLKSIWPAARSLWRELPAKLKSKNSSSTNQTLDQELLLKVRGRQHLPSWRQWRYLHKFYSHQEILATKIALFFILASSLALGVNIYFNNLEKIPAAGGRYAEAIIGAPTYVNPLFSQTNVECLGCHSEKSFAMEKKGKSISLFVDGKKFASSSHGALDCAAQGAPEAGDIVFTGRDDEFRDILRRGALLEVVTFGFYRFWLATKIRQHLWSHTLLDGDAFAYLGTARELLIGFLVAIAILAPIYLASFLLGVEAERAQSFASSVFGVFFLTFWQFAIYRARRYRLHRTAWRGLRFHMDGSGVSYALRAMGWGFVSVVTLGLALPWMQAALERYKMRHTYYGDLSGDFVATAGDFLKRGWRLWIWAAFTPAACVAGLAFAGNGLLLILPVAAAIFIEVYARFKALQWKWWLEGVRIGDVRATSTLEANALTRNYWIFVGLLFASAVAAAIALWVVLSFPPRFVGIPIAVLIYLALIVQYSILWRTYFIQRVWRIVVNSLTIHNLHTAQEVAMRLDASSPTALGEGFADSLDVAGF